MNFSPRKATMAAVAAIALTLTGCAGSSFTSSPSVDGSSSGSSASGSNSNGTSSGGSSKPSDEPNKDGWVLKYSEDFSQPLGVEAHDWQIDPLGKESPWYVDEFSDDGEYFTSLGGENFDKALASMNVMRKRVAVGQDNWLTVELAAQDRDKDGRPDHEPSITSENGVGKINVPINSTGAILTATNPLPSQYRIEYELKTVDFGGKRPVEVDGQTVESWEYDGKFNGHAPVECGTNFPWTRKEWHDETIDAPNGVDPCAKPFGDTKAENGYYFLSIMDYAHPAPHNNIFIHSHRKVNMDSYSVSGSWAKSYKVCNPSDGSLIPYPDSTGNGVNQIFMDGKEFRDPAFAYNQFVMPTPCGLKIGDDKEATIVATAEIQPELMPNQTYKFAIERTGDSYVTEMTGLFKHMDHVVTIRNERKFVEDDGRAIWHYNQTPEEYDGSLDQTLTFGPERKPEDKFSKQMWPKDSAYPDNFVIGEPHLNFYTGTATIDNIKLYTR